MTSVFWREINIMKHSWNNNCQSSLWETFGNFLLCPEDILCFYCIHIMCLLLNVDGSSNLIIFQIKPGKEQFAHWTNNKVLFEDSLAFLQFGYLFSISTAAPIGLLQTIWCTTCITAHKIFHKRELPKTFFSLTSSIMRIVKWRFLINWISMCFLPRSWMH